ncbi:hypothetical protein [Leptothoe sp. PORK10 BA2]|uniref:hypothetical protein n=1 Tax=Leptothoe sp. PORK10 BA2 TaxID=3110254 RepID=UPI002B1FC701|nr:hypothetical protein [Leptothoe sp. PORK10 BA2]MEA5463716.1 hypothetical protein [Leptothoe sp. PORK10 BA2]
MTSQTRTISSQVSNLDRTLAATLAAFSMFVVGYTAVRVYLAQPAANTPVPTVIPHQAELWSELGR